MKIIKIVSFICYMVVAIIGLYMYVTSVEEIYKQFNPAQAKAIAGAIAGVYLFFVGWVSMRQLPK